MIISKKRQMPLEYNMRDMKKFTSVEIIYSIEKSSNNVIEQKLNYIHDNPVKQGLVNLAECYNWSSAIDYTGGKGLVEIEML